MQKYALVMCFGIMTNSGIVAMDSGQIDLVAQREQSFMEVKNFCDKFKDAIHKIQFPDKRRNLYPLLKKLLEIDDKLTRGTVLDHSKEGNLDYLIDIIFYNTIICSSQDTLNHLNSQGTKHQLDQYARINQLKEGILYNWNACHRRVHRARQLDFARSDWFKEKFLTVGTTIVSRPPIYEHGK